MECAFTSPVTTEPGMFVMCCMQCCMSVRVSCFVLRGCAVSRGYINVCNSDVFSVVNMYVSLSLTSVMSLSPDMCDLSVHMVVKLCMFLLWE